MKINRAKLNLLLDAAIAMAFTVEAVTGFVLAIVLPHGGYQGGRNPLVERSFIVTRDVWLSLHDWFALVIILGVLVHIVLHWRWIICMVRRLWREASAKPVSPAGQDCSL